MRREEAGMLSCTISTNISRTPRLRLRADLGEILDYIAEHRPLTAVAVTIRIREKCNLLASQPLIGQERPEFPVNYRSVPVDSWIIFHRSQATPWKSIESLTAPGTSTA